ncbi:hypothetical protein Tco_0451505 [Tanacetum coccineum]
MFRGTLVISAGFQAKISKFCLSKEHSSLRPFSVNVDPMATVFSGYSGWIAIFIFSSSTWFTAGGWMLAREDIAHFIRMTLLSVTLLCVVDGTARIFLMPGLPIIALCWDGDLMTLKFIQAKVECTSSPIFTSKAIWPTLAIWSLADPIKLLRIASRRQYIPYAKSCPPISSIDDHGLQSTSSSLRGWEKDIAVSGE